MSWAIADVSGSSPYASVQSSVCGAGLEEMVKHWTVFMVSSSAKVKYWKTWFQGLSDSRMLLNIGCGTHAMRHESSADSKWVVGLYCLVQFWNPYIASSSASDTRRAVHAPVEFRNGIANL